jgi:hypothetical protein
MKKGFKVKQGLKDKVILRITLINLKFYPKGQVSMAAPTPRTLPLLHK